MANNSTLKRKIIPSVKLKETFAIEGLKFERGQIIFRSPERKIVKSKVKTVTKNRVPSCAIECCDKSTRGRRSFRFPDSNQEQKKLWMSECRLSEVGPGSRICSNHFVSGAPSKTRLDIDYVPFVFRKRPETEAELVAFNKERREVQEKIEQVVENQKSNHIATKQRNKIVKEKSIAEGGKDLNKETPKNLLLKISYLEKQNSYLKGSNAKLTKTNEDLLDRIEKKNVVTFRGTQTRFTDHSDDAVEYSDDEFVELTPKDWVKSISRLKETKLKKSELSRKTVNMVAAEQRGELASYMKQLEKKYERRRKRMKLVNKERKENNPKLESIAKLQPIDPDLVPESVKMAFQAMLNSTETRLGSTGRDQSGLVSMKNPVC